MASISASASLRAIGLLVMRLKATNCKPIRAPGRRPNDYAEVLPRRECCHTETSLLFPRPLETRRQLWATFSLVGQLPDQQSERLDISGDLQRASVDRIETHVTEGLVARAWIRATVQQRRIAWIRANSFQLTAPPEAAQTCSLIRRLSLRHSITAPFAPARARRWMGSPKGRAGGLAADSSRRSRRRAASMAGKMRVWGETSKRRLFTHLVTHFHIYRI